MAATIQGLFQRCWHSWASGSGSVILATILVAGCGGGSSSPPPPIDNGGDSGGDPDVVTTLGEAPPALEGTWEGEFSYDEGSVGFRGRPVVEHAPAMLIDGEGDGLTTVTFTVDYTVSAEGVVSGTYTDSEGRSGTVSGTYNAETNDFEISVDPEEGQDFALSFEATVQLDESGSTTGSFSGTVAFDPDTTDEEPPFVGTATASKRFFGSNSATIAPHPLLAVPTGEQTWTLDSTRAEYTVTTASASVAYTGSSTAYDVAVIRQTSDYQNLNLARGYDGGIYDLQLTVDDPAESELAERLLPAVITKDETFAVHADDDKEFTVKTLQGFSFGGFNNVIVVESSGEYWVFKPEIGLVEWKTSEDRGFLRYTPTFGADSDDISADFLAGTWGVFIEGEDDAVLTVTQSADSIEWNEQTIAAVKLTVTSSGDQLENEEWIAKDDRGAIYTLRGIEYEDGIEVESEEHNPPSIFLPPTLSLGQEWVGFEDRSLEVVSVNSTTPNDITGAVEIVETAPGNWADTVWVKDGQVVAFRWVDLAGSDPDEVIYRIEPGDDDSGDGVQFGADSGNITPAQAGSWASFNWEGAAYASEPTGLETWTVEEETITYNGSSVATQVVSLAEKDGPVFEKLWLAQDTTGALYELQKHDMEDGADDFVVHPSPLLWLPATPVDGAQFNGAGGQMTVASLNATSPGGVTGCVLITHVDDGTLVSHWFKDRTLVGWRWDEEDQGYPFEGSGPDDGIEFGANSADIIPAQTGSWASFNWEGAAYASEPTGLETWTVEEETITYNGSSVATQVVSIAEKDGPVFEKLWLAQDTTGALYELQKHDMEDGADDFVVHPSPLLWLPATPVDGAQFNGAGGQMTVASLNATSPGGVTGCVLITHVDDGTLVSHWFKDRTLVGWRWDEEDQGYPYEDSSDSIFGADSGEITPVAAGVWTNRESSNGVDWTHTGDNQITVSTEALSWNGETVMTAMAETDLGESDNYIEWYARSTDGDIFTLKVVEDSEEMELVPPLLSYPAAPELGQSWPGDEGETSTVISVNGVSPGNIDGCVVIELVGIDQTNTYWWKNGTLVAWQWSDGAITKQSWVTLEFGVDSADITPIEGGFWGVFPWDSEEGAFVEHADELEGVSISEESLTYLGESVATIHFLFAFEGGSSEGSWVAKDSDGVYYELQALHSDGVIEVFNPPQVWLPASLDVDVSWTNSDGTFTVVETNAEAPDGRSGTIRVGSTHGETRWYLGRTLIAWRWESAEDPDDKDQGYALGASAPSAGFTAIEAGTWGIFEWDPVLEAYATEPGEEETVAVSTETISYLGVDVETVHFLFTFESGDTEGSWLIQDSQGSYFEVRSISEDGTVTNYDPKQVWLPASLEVGTMWTNSDGTFTVTDTNAESPNGITGCVLATNGETSHWYKDRVLVAWRWESSENPDERDQGYRIGD